MCRYNGSSLIELLVSLLIFSIVLLGLDASQIIALKQAKTSYHFFVAKQQIKNITEALHLKNNNFSRILKNWNQQNAQVLPQGKGVVTGNYPHYSIEIFWGKNPSLQCTKNRISIDGCLHTDV